jgi:very-short-patch-repair endonuclease
MRRQHAPAVTAQEISQLLAEGDGVILRREHTQLRGSLARAAERGQLAAVLPGVFVASSNQRDPITRIKALARYDPDIIFTGQAAARMSFWPELRLQQVSAAARHSRQNQRGYLFTRRAIPLDLVSERRGVRYTNASLTALDLSNSNNADAIDTALRTRAATLESLHHALRLTPHRRGNTDTRRVLLDSRDAPWSRAEREGHRLLRAAKVTGWRTNYPFLDLGHLYYLDIAFPSIKLAVEIDGRFHEDDPGVFEADRWRQNALVLNGWRVLRFTWPMLRDHPEQFVQAVRRAVSLRGI